MPNLHFSIFATKILKIFNIRKQTAQNYVLFVYSSLVFVFDGDTNTLKVVLRMPFYSTTTPPLLHLWYTRSHPYGYTHDPRGGISLYQLVYQ